MNWEPEISKILVIITESSLIYGFFHPSGRTDSLLSNGNRRAIKLCEYGFAMMGVCAPRDSHVNRVVIH